MTRRLWLLPICALLLAACFLVYYHRLQISARIWHWRHGDSLQVGEYLVPVPARWMVLTASSDGRDVTFIDSHVTKQAGLWQGANIFTVDRLNYPVHDLDYWVNVKRQVIQKEALRDDEEKTLQIDEERVICMGGSELTDVVHVPNTSVLSLECLSSGSLSLMFVGYRSGLPEFYAIVSEIHKR